MEIPQPDQDSSANVPVIVIIGAILVIVALVITVCILIAE